MSIRNRLEDAQLLWRSGHLEGAFLSALVAVAATSRRKFPKPIKDIDAFERFLNQGWFARLSVEYRGEAHPMFHIFYKWFRCELAHEGSLPFDIEILQHPKQDDQLINSSTTLNAPNLKFVGGCIKIAGNGSLNAPNLKTIGGECTVDDSASLTVANLESSSGSLWVRAGGAPNYVLQISCGWFDELVGTVIRADVNRDLFPNQHEFKRGESNLFEAGGTARVEKKG